MTQILIGPIYQTFELPAVPEVGSILNLGGPSLRPARYEVKEVVGEKNFGGTEYVHVRVEHTGSDVAPGEQVLSVMEVITVAAMS